MAVVYNSMKVFRKRNLTKGIFLTELSLIISIYLPSSYFFSGQPTFCNIFLNQKILFSGNNLNIASWTWSVWWGDGFLRIFTLAFLPFLAPAGSIF